MSAADAPATPSLPTLGLAFLAVLGGVGGFGPDLGQALREMGYPPAEVGALLAVIPLMNALATPIWAALADRLQTGARFLQLAVLSSLCVVGAISTGALPVWGLGLALATYGVMRAPVGPLLDSMTVKALEAQGADPRAYGRVRLWGSVGFLTAGGLAGVLAGALPQPGAPLWVAVGCWTLGLVVVARLPATRAAAPVALGPAARALAATPGLGWLLLALPLHGLGLNAYDSWYAMLLAERGLGGGWTGAAIVVGVLAEVGLMAASTRALGGRDPVGLLVLCLAVAAARWALVAVIEEPVLLTALQLSHALVFALFWLAVTETMRRRAPAALRASGQALVLVATYGLGPVLTSALGAVISPRFGVVGLFWAASAAAALAAGAAALAWRRGVGAPAAAR
jgi:PPP family 3-phenylpropionic acid transporter